MLTGNQSIRKSCVSCGEIFDRHKLHIVALGDEKLEHLICDSNFTSRWNYLTEECKASYHVTEYRSQLYAIAENLLNKERKDTIAQSVFRRNQSIIQDFQVLIMVDCQRV